MRHDRLLTKVVRGMVFLLWTAAAVLTREDGNAAEPDARFEATFSRVSTSFAELPVVFNRAFTLHGGAEDGGVLLSGMKVVSDAGKRIYFGSEWHSTFRIDAQEQTFARIKPDDWPMGVTYDSKRDRVLVVTLGGEGFLYALHPNGTNVTEIASMANKDVDNLEYHAPTDTLYALEHGSAGTILKFNPEGRLIGQFNIGGFPWPVYVHGYKSELFSVGESLVLFLEPIYPQEEFAEESRIYLIDPVAGTAEMTYRKVWEKWPPVNTPPTVRITAPSAGAEFVAGATITLEALASDHENTIDTLKFFVNGQEVGQGQSRMTGSFSYVYELNHKINEPGEYTVVAVAKDFDGASTSSAPVTFRVGAKPVSFGVKITMPASGASFKFGTDISLVAEVLAEGTDTVGVLFYANDALIGAGTRVLTFAPTDKDIFAFTWTNAPIGTHALTARARASNGQMATSEPVTIKVDPREDDSDVFQVFFATPKESSESLLVDREYTITRGPLDGGALITGMRVVPDLSFVKFYGAHSHNVYEVNGPAGTIRSILPTSGEDFSWPMGVAYNSETYQPVLVTLGGEGFLYGYDTTSERWSRIASMNNLDLDSIDYDPERKTYFGASAFIRRDNPVRVHEISKDGTKLQTITVFDAIPTSGPEYYTSETIDLPNGKVAIFLEPSGFDLTGGQSRIYVVDPVAKTATLTYAKLWERFPGITVEILQPRDGATIEAGSVVEITARARQGARPVEGVQFHVNGQVLGAGLRDRMDPTLFRYRWVNAPAGAATITARAVAVGATVVSRPVTVTIGSLSPLISAVRDLPPAYTPGTILQVKIAVTVSDAMNAYAVEDVPPAGWQVSAISHEGVYDPVTRKVKFGLFTDSESRVLSYWLTPPPTSTEQVSFHGHASGNGNRQVITGDNSLAVATLRHPADRSPNDYRLTMEEVTSYAAAWKEGVSWPEEVGTIPVSYVTAAGMLWKHGEQYEFDPSAGPAPYCWVPSGESGSGVFEALASGAATRSIERTGSVAQVQIMVQPQLGGAAYAVEERIPVGWTVNAIEGGGVIAGDVIRWGPFFDSVARTLSYSASGGDRDGLFHGSISFDGSQQIVGGETKIALGGTNLELTRNGTAIRLGLSAAAAVDGVIEATDSLGDGWIAVGTVSAGSSEAEVQDPGTGSRFFRIRFE